MSGMGRSATVADRPVAANQAKGNQSLTILIGSPVIYADSMNSWDYYENSTENLKGCDVNPRYRPFLLSVK